MKRVTTILFGALAASALLMSTGPAAGAATGEVVVFSAEVVQLEVYEHPRGCNALPTGAHVLANRTNQPVRIYGTPECFGIPVLTVEENWGSHVPPAAASFRV
ncbi:hypothetical protein [Umezawaea sp. Da 62-37]|uniref:hypothetical protein n=1 Tax=Umezawaea sp. Da 62-37 TaxID=3075927 RepID=UPI0028F6E407|nr:hypothetical protein [Umezawaea sp. Da 62-37]WNV82873.1 hypothetical protein RM788_32360 [Umezawaea sp. Da 62-37]